MIVLLRERRVLAGSVIMRWLRRWGDLGCPGDELARAGELLGTCVAPVGEQAVVPDAVEALGQHVHQEAPDKLVRVKPHRLPAAWAVDAIVLARNAMLVLSAATRRRFEMATRCV